MAVLVSGSVAIDHIMVFRGRFKDLILPQHVHALNVAFHVPELRHTWGGCAANIAFHLRLLGEENQITGFHPGAMERAHEVRVDEVGVPYSHAIVSPNGKRAMVENARALKARGTPTIVDPGQGLPILDRDELVEMIEGAAVYIVNDYEWSLTLERSGLDGDAVARRAGVVIVTQGERGSLLRRGADVVEIPSVAAEKVVDPTGAGDAYRAGLLYGLVRGASLEHAARIGSLLGALQVAYPGTQNLDMDLGTFRTRFEREFGTPL
jgi:adenosine kinase